MANAVAPTAPRPFWIADRAVMGRGEPLSVLAPYDRRPLWSFSTPDREQLEAMVAAAQTAFVESRRRGSRAERARGLRTLARQIAASVDEWTRIICLEAGKPWAASRFEVLRVVEYLDLVADALRTDNGGAVAMDAMEGGRGRRGWWERVPWGVVLAVSPFNAPLNLAVQKLAPALAMGNAVILKPSPYTPMTAYRLVEAAREAGFAPGLVHFVAAAGPQTVWDLAGHPGINLVSLTGSTQAGRDVVRAAGLKPCVLELGSSAPNLVFADAPLPRVARSLAAAGFAAAGQACIAAQRILVERSVFEPFLQALVEEAQALRLGDPLDAATQVGPMISPAAVERVLQAVTAAQARGGRLIYGGRVVDNNLMPTVVTGLAPDDPLHTEEIFGPVVSVLPFRDREEAVTLANATPYGLQAGVFTQDLTTAFWVADRLDSGSVWINESSRYRQDNYPFGGTKASGYGREGVPWALAAMSQVKFIGVAGLG